MICQGLKILVSVVRFRPGPPLIYDAYTVAYDEIHESFFFAAREKAGLLRTTIKVANPDARMRKHIQLMISIHLNLKLSVQQLAGVTESSYK